MTAWPSQATRADHPRNVDTAEGVSSILADKHVVLDCRWLGLGGAGTATATLLRELAAAPPPGKWTYWGIPSKLDDLSPQGVRVVPSDGDPRSLAGQRDLFRVPPGDVVLYMHQIRPLRWGRNLTVIHDTIPLRYGGSAFTRGAKWAFFLLTAHTSTRVLTGSEHARRRIQRDLRVRPERIDVVAWPVDFVRQERVASLRLTLPPEPVLLYVGRFATHKNLERLCVAFGRSRFAAEGGRLLLLGGWGGEVTRLRDVVESLGVTGIDVRSTCTQEELDYFFATSRALIAPSLEEGYGLPAFEAAAAGLPVAVSHTGAMARLPGELATRLDPYSVDDIRRAIDEVTTRHSVRPWRMCDGSLRGVILASLAACFAGARG